MSEYNLVADVGATNARFALTQGLAHDLLHIEILPCADYESIEAAALTYLKNHDKLGVIANVCIAIAGTVHLDQFQLANNHWFVDKAKVNQALDAEVLWINDFTAQAWAMSRIEPDQLLTVKEGQPVERGNRLVMGPGTGMGVAGLVAHDNGWLPVMGEGGHVSVSATNVVQAQILEFMLHQFDHVSVERLLSGSGMMNLYNAMAHIRGAAQTLQTPAEVVANALKDEPDALAHETLSVFCDMVANAVANNALTLGAVGGVYLTGGILPRMKKFLLESDFNSIFVNKGRTSAFLKNIPIYLCTAEQPGLQGSVIALHDQLGRHNVTA